ncbi:MAG: outer membrane protein assembly factor BamD [Candidatus Krumholzibacteria bacterium]|nr:outer membrane protein assembly factor BamD [Candidatus Krumholzibacteria bacterium]
MINHFVDKYSTRAHGLRPLAGVVGVLALLLVGCAGGLPSIPNSSDAILEKGDAYFARKKYLQAQELYKAFLLRFPGDDRSDYAQFRLAESLFAGEDYALAAVEYHVLVSNYGYSEYADDGFFKGALCYYYQALKPPLDQAQRMQALDKLEQFARVFPQSPLAPQAREHIQKIHEKLAQKAFANAMFYVRKKRASSSIIYLDKIITKYPNNDFWARAFYLKGKILLERGETEEAIRMFSQVMAYPRDVDVKEEARRELQKLRND